jgi:hypothetical protein
MGDNANIIEDNIDPHDRIVQLESRIEALSDKIENCRKFILASRLAIVLGGAILLGGLFGAITLDALMLSTAVVSALGGIVLLGSNNSTAKEAQTQRAQAEAERAALIGSMGLRVVSERPTLH